MSGDFDRYGAYAEGTVLNSDPVHLIILLYERAIQALDDARECLIAGDLAGRAKHVSKAVAIISELLMSLRDEQGGDISQNLRRLYMYMQSQLLQAHARRDSGALDEVRSLLSTLLEGWRTLFKKESNAASSDRGQYHAENPADAETASYGSYLGEAVGCSLVASF